MPADQHLDGREGAWNQKIPLIISYAILLLTWPAFVLVLSGHGTLYRNHQWLRFIEQQITYHGLLFMTLVSLYLVSSSSPGRPDQSLAPEDAKPPNPTSPVVAEDEDGIPPRAVQSRIWMELRSGKDRPSPLPLATASSPTSSVGFPIMTPFPFAPSPFTPLTATAAGTSASSEASLVARSLPELDTTDENAALLESEPRHAANVTAKGSTGGLRWCKKCDGWKPDRCHHCRFCKRCTLKMDHHCIWVGSCVGYRNYKPFLLFLTYGTLLAIYCGCEAGYEVYRFFSDPNAFVTQLPAQPAPMCPPNKACPPHYSMSEKVDFAPVAYIILAVMAAFLGLSVGSLCSYHWYLTANNITTLENVTHAFPAALLADSGKSGSSTSATSPHRSPQWRPEHLLTRHERVKLRNEAREINVFDLGWRRNVHSIMIGHRASWWSIALPWMRPKSTSFDAGHSFPIDERALKRLRDLTVELRLAGKAEEPTESEGSDGEAENDDETLDVPGSQLQQTQREMRERDSQRPNVAWFQAGSAV